MNKKPSITILFILFLTASDIFSQAPLVFPRLSPDPLALEFNSLYASNQNLTWFELAQIALWASGDTSITGIVKNADAVSAGSSLGKIITETASLSARADYPSNGRDRAQFILEYLYANILKTYSLTQTRIDTIFTNGRYNCVSSAVLYMIFCEYSGINSSGVITRDHALLTLHINGEDIDVETTNRYGFDPGNRREFLDQFGRLTGFTYVPARNYRDRQSIGKIELISIIFNNRISDLERQGRYAEAVPLAIDKAALLHGRSLNVSLVTSESELFADARLDLMDRLLNYGVSLLRANREEESLLWAAAASPLYPDSERWQEFIFAAVNNRIARYLRDKKITEARNFLDSSKNILSEENYSQLDTIVLDQHLLERANQIAGISDADAVIAAIEQARVQRRISAARAQEMITFAIQKTAVVLSAAPARNWRASISYLENAISVYGANRELNQALQVYRNNLVSDYHNRFAAEWNRRNYAEAERILEDGLREFPENLQLLSDWDIVQRQRAR